MHIYSHMIQQSFLHISLVYFLEAKVQAQLQHQRCEKAKQDLSNGRKAGHGAAGQPRSRLVWGGQLYGQD